MPFEPGDVRINLACGKRDDGLWHGMLSIQIPSELLRQLGLHPDQPWSLITGPEPPGWWRAEALRHMLGPTKHRRRHRG